MMYVIKVINFSFKSKKKLSFNLYLWYKRTFAISISLLKINLCFVFTVLNNTSKNKAKTT